MAFEEYSIEQLRQAVPQAILRTIEASARQSDRALAKEDFLLVYRNPDQTVSRDLLAVAITEVAQAPGLGVVDRISAEAELNSHWNLLFAENPISRLGAVMSEMANQMTATPPQPAQMSRQEPVGIEDAMRLMQSSNRTALIGSSGIPFDLARLAPEALRRGRSSTVNGAWNDFYPPPDWTKLGISRAAGPATPEEMQVLLGTSMMDNQPLTPDRVLSVGACYGDNNVIEDRWRYIPPTELIRLGYLMVIRSKGSDTDHYRRALDCSFLVCSPMIGMDRGVELHPDHPLKGLVPYMALTGRALFPYPEQDEKQISAVEAVRQARAKRVSMLFAHTAVTCGTCGEIPVRQLYGAESSIIGLGIAPADMPDLFAYATGYDYRLYIDGLLRWKADVPGGWMYREVMINAVTTDGVVVIDPTTADIPDGAVLMLKMENIFYWGGTSVPHYCPLHYLEGMVMMDGTRTIGAFANVQQLLNVALTDQGAINNAQLVLDPAIKV